MASENLTPDSKGSRLSDKIVVAGDTAQFATTDTPINPKPTLVIFERLPTEIKHMVIEEYLAQQHLLSVNIFPYPEYPLSRHSLGLKSDPSHAGRISTPNKDFRAIAEAPRPNRIEVYLLSTCVVSLRVSRLGSSS